MISRCPHARYDVWCHALFFAPAGGPAEADEGVRRVDVVDGKDHPHTGGGHRVVRAWVVAVVDGAFVLWVLSYVVPPSCHRWCIRDTIRCVVDLP